jgi:hypothetical protein
LELFVRNAPLFGMEWKTRLMMALKAAPPVVVPGNTSLAPARSSSSGSSSRPCESVVNSALERLHTSPYRGLRSVELDVNGNTMVLTGQVRTFFLKQMAQHLLGDYSGVWEIRNNLRVA